ncbi:MAG: hypothetical protein ABJC13_20560 [Acidobacteriota bacterium]
MRSRSHLLALLLVLGCGRERFELGKDSQGRTVRLDRQTGKVELVDSLIASSGSPSPSPSAGSPPNPKPAPDHSEAAAEKIILVEILDKRFTKAGYEDFVAFDFRYTASGLDRPTRAVKGKMLFQDLFGETHLTLGWTIDKPLAPNETADELGSGLDYNQFMDDHKWARFTEKGDMKAVFRVQSIIYADGTRVDFE